MSILWLLEWTQGKYREIVDWLVRLSWICSNLSSVNEFSVDCASDGSRSKRLIDTLTKLKLRAFPTRNGTWYGIFTWLKEWVLWCACNVTPDWGLAALISQQVRTGAPWVAHLILIWFRTVWILSRWVQAVYELPIQYKPHWPHCTLRWCVVPFHPVVIWYWPGCDQCKLSVCV